MDGGSYQYYLFCGLQVERMCANCQNPEIALKFTEVIEKNSRMEPASL
jgi:hypothetical protein